MIVFKGLNTKVLAAQKDVVTELMAKTLVLGGPTRCCIKILRMDVLVSFKISRCGMGTEKMKIHAELLYKQRKSIKLLFVQGLCSKTETMHLHKEANTFDNHVYPYRK